MKSLHHSFDIDVASEYGVHEAIIIHHFQNLIKINKSLNRNFHQGRYWICQSVDFFISELPYFTRDKFRNYIEKLCKIKTRFNASLDHEPVLIKGNFNNNSFDRTTWYAFIDENKWVNGGHIL